MKTVAITLGVTIAASILGGLIIIYSGLFNVATAWKDPALMRWVLVTTRENSVESRAASIEVPLLKETQRIEEGFRSYREMCAICHTPPEATASPIAKGLNPAAPDLAKVAEHESAAEIFWVVKNGIRMTGMPAWGKTHKDAALWDIVAFIKESLPNLTGADYLALDRRLPKGHSHTGGDDHGHDGGTDANEHADGDEHSHDDSSTHDSMTGNTHADDLLIDILP